MPNSRDLAIGSRVRRRGAAFLILAGTAMLAWCAYYLADEYYGQWIARRAFASAQVIAESPASAGSTPPAFETRSPNTQAAAPERGAVVARITVPRLKLSAIVLHGSDEKTLRRAPGHLENTAIPGEAGNAVIAGHRDTFFRPLEHVQIGDDIYMETTAGRFHYRVASTHVVKPQDLSVLDPTDEPVLTLITCFPFWVFGDAPDRFIVRATGVDETGPAFTPAVARLHEAYPVPTAPRRAANSTSPRATATGSMSNDHAAVRQAIERFRVAYNARATTHPEGGAVPLSFRSCEVNTETATATATCTSAVDDHARDRAFTLVRAGSGWAIRSVLVP